MTACPDLSSLEATPLPAPVQDHVDACLACQLVVEVFVEVDGVRDDACDRFDALLAARGDGSLNEAGRNLLERHLASCAACRDVADTLSPRADRDGDHAALPRIDPSAYALGLEVARGGMGRILMARDLRVGRPVAVKELLDRSPQLAARFEREARVTARLQHPGIVPIYEIGKWPDGTPFYSMRMVDGRTLGDAIAAAPSLAQRLALLPAVIAAAEAVAFAHAQRVIHRDLTPSNVLVGAYGETVVIDWGLAKDLSLGDADEDADRDPYRMPTDASLTGVGAVIGTAAYMPPEQAHARPVDERADVYALGAILYHVLAGAPPYRGRTRDLLRAVQASPPPAVDQIVPMAPRDLVSIVTKAMARDPTRRYPSARELAEELKRFQTGRMVEAHAYSTVERALRFVRRYRAAVTVSALAVIVLAAFASVAVTRILRSRTEARSTAHELLLEKGRVELLAGNTLGGLAYLHAAAAGGARTPALTFLLDTAIRGASSSTVLDCGGFVFLVAVSPDGESLAAACADHARIWRLRDRALIATLGPFPGGFYNMRFARHGGMLATWGRDGVARLWDARTGAHRGSFSHGAEISMTTFSPDASRLVTTGFDGVARVWDAATQRQLRAITASSALFRHLYGMLSPDGDHILTITIEGEGKGWDAHTGELLGGFSHGSFVLGGDLSADGTLAVSCGLDRLTRVWNARTGAHQLTLAGHTDVVWKCLFDQAGTRALTTGHDGRANVWDLADGALITSVEHGDIVWSGRFSPDGRRFATIGVDGRVKVWDARSGALLASHDSRRGKDATFLPDSRGLVVQRGDGRIEIWNDSSNQAAAFRPPSGTTVQAVSADGTRVVTEATTGWLTLWDTAAARPVPTPALHAPVAMATRAPVLAAGSSAGVAVIDLRTGTPLATLDAVSPRHLELTATAERLAIVPADGPPEIWELASRRRLTVLAGMTGIHLSADGRSALAWASDRAPIVWNVDRAAPGVSVGVGPDARPLGFAADNARVAVLEAPGTPGQIISVWDTTTGARVLREPAASATLDPSGTWLTTIHADSRVTVWSLATGEEMSSFQAEQLLDAQIDPRRALIAAIGAYGTVGLVLHATDGRVLARWPIEHAAPAVTQTGFRPPRAMATWSPDATKLVTHSRSIAVWHAASEGNESLATVMRRVPWRIVNGRPVLLRDRTLRARVVDRDEPIAHARVSVEIRIAPDVGGAVINWDAIRTRYTERTVTTDGDGRFEVPGLAPGTYAVTIAPGGATERTFEAFVSADPDDAAEQTLDVAASR